MLVETLKRIFIDSSENTFGIVLYYINLSRKDTVTITLISTLLTVYDCICIYLTYKSHKTKHNQQQIMSICDRSLYAENICMLANPSLARPILT